MELELEPDEQRESMRLGSALVLGDDVRPEQAGALGAALVARVEAVREPHPYGKP